jgi:hypothetical protein
VREKSNPVGIGTAASGNQRHSVRLILCALAFAPACSQGPANHSIDGSRIVESTSADFGKSTTTAERFGLSKSPGSTSSVPQSPHGVTDVSGSATKPSGLAWTTPAGWKEKAPLSMRVANFAPGGDERAECYLTMLSGDAGGLGANVNRWRTQLGLSPLGSRELEALPMKPMFGHDAVFVDFAGTWKGMGGTDAKEHWRLAGMLLFDPNGSAFLKMTGPDDVVEAQIDAMCELATSFRSAGTPAERTDASAMNNASDAATSSSASASMSNTGTSSTASSAAMSNTGGTHETAGGFSFTMPAGWHKAPDRPARAFTLFAGAGESLECYVTSLGGDAGGTLANVNRWRGQLGLTPVGDTDLAAMSKVQVMGHDAVLVECDGAAASLIGASCNGSDRSVFVKMTGPRDLVKAQRSAFLAFCASLGEGK